MKYQHYIKQFIYGLCFGFVFMYTIAMGLMIYHADMPIQDSPIIFPNENLNVFEIIKTDESYGVMIHPNMLWLVLSFGVFNLTRVTLCQKK